MSGTPGSKEPWGWQRPEGPRRGRWSAEEVARFRELYGLKDEAYISRELGRSIPSLRRMAKRLFGGAPRRGAWSDEDVARLKRYLGASPIDVVASILRRTPADVRRKIAELATVRSSAAWSPEEKQEFKRIYGTRSDEDLAIVFGRRLASIRALAEELRLSKDKAFLRKRSGGEAATRMPRWSREELDLLVRLYPRTPNLEIARRLERSVKSVVSKAYGLGLKKDPARLREMGRQNVRSRRDADDGGRSGRSRGARG